MLSAGEWRALFDAFEKDAWRFEAQPVYTMPGERDSLARFLRGEPKPDDHNAAWHARVQEYRSEGRRIGRVRVVRRPLTDYQRYQFAWGIPGNIAAGEEIRVLDVTDDDHGLRLSGRDWWMFDEATVVHLDYRPDGTQIGRFVYHGDPEPYRRWKRIALAASVPFRQYAEEHG
ncbi:MULTISPECIES: DUF6879 family protein [Streptomyces]|uniref:DUF6879 family protein n=1 Tax=Streptomyces TaxID=1883 RepID=UPI00163CAD7F|nr:MULTISPECIES: DUF6879 family protein [Streptomyces]MBC2879187.1 hypothetical protein [Streptomyces sp. TYQ1024]UBI38539.1 hypothetical protein K7I03_20115 [Streptomyces mobaraensis]UKW31123.1 hypothetical protein MCU78_20070 [Streptomyces sp. TYQ1024]